MNTRTHCLTDLTGPQWAKVYRVIPASKKWGRPAKYDGREVVDALLNGA